MTLPTDPTVNTAPADLARMVDCITEADLCRLAGVSPATAETWRKRGTGPTCVRFGNTFLYPTAQLAEFLRKRVRSRGTITAKSVL
ncbi:MAG: helix-turn-helix transcriptional regulator [Betaproteobacteria bacterium]